MREKFSAKEFGQHFKWGFATSAFQHEGAISLDSRMASIWDGKFKKRGRELEEYLSSADFYHNYKKDLKELKRIGATEFRLSISWSRLFLNNRFEVNRKGLEFYHAVLDECHSLGLTPWVCLYHWDLPNYIQEQGGWVNRKVANWFAEFAEACVHHFQSKVKHWIILNEALSFTGAGHYLGIHPPGKRGLKNFLPAVHHALLAQGRAYRRMKALDPMATVGTCLAIIPVDTFEIDHKHFVAKEKLHAVLNRLFVEPMLGLGYPSTTLPFLAGMDKYVQKSDMQEIHFRPDFIGIQTYTRLVVKPCWYMPYVKARLVHPKKRGKPTSAMNWEIHPRAIFKSLRYLQSYGSIPPLFITELGIPLEDHPKNGEVNDELRENYLKSSLKYVKQAKQKGLDIRGVLFWSLTDNLEWDSGYKPRFGLLHVDFKTKKRIWKNSAYWLEEFLSEVEKPAFNPRAIFMSQAK